jgi:hypothetical protein
MLNTVIFNPCLKSLDPLELVVLKGKEPGQRYLIPSGEHRYGRDTDNDIVMDHPTVSRKHGRISYLKNREVLFYDHDSKNGISQDGQVATEILLKVSQSIHIGNTCLKLVKVRKKRMLQVISICGMALFIGAFSLVTYMAASISPQKIPPKTVAKIVKPQTKFPTQTIVQQKVNVLNSQAIRAFASKHYKKAFMLWSQILRQQSDNPSAQEGLKKLEQVSKKLFEEALMIQAMNPHKTQELLQVVMDITTPTSAIHKQGKKLFYSTKDS